MALINKLEEHSLTSGFGWEETTTAHQACTIGLGLESMLISRR